MKMTPMRYMLAALLIVCLCTAGVSGAPTTEVLIAKIDGDTGAILDETTVDYHWMEENLPVHGDGVTRYYHQGPVFEGDKWDPGETTNFKDRGAVKGTNIRDLCDLVGGASPGDEIMVRAADGYHVEFPYENVYHPAPRQGPIVLCWYNGADPDVGERQGIGYPPDFYAGMRIVFFADTSTNAEGLHVYGNQDMYETMPSTVHHFYDLFPSTNGFTVKWVDEIRIYAGGYHGETGALAKSLTDDGSQESTTPEAGPPPIAALLAVLGCLFITASRGRQ